MFAVITKEIFSVSVLWICLWAAAAVLYCICLAFWLLKDWKFVYLEQIYVQVMQSLRLSIIQLQLQCWCLSWNIHNGWNSVTGWRLLQVFILVWKWLVILVFSALGCIKNPKSDQISRLLQSDVNPVNITAVTVRTASDWWSHKGGFPLTILS